MYNPNRQLGCSSLALVRWGQQLGGIGSVATVVVAAVAAAAMWQLQLAVLVAAGSVGGSLTAAGRQQ
jgi:hypothetical protein